MKKTLKAVAQKRVRGRFLIVEARESDGSVEILRKLDKRSVETRLSLRDLTFDALKLLLKEPQ